MTTDISCFYLQNRLIQTSQTGGQRYSDTCPLEFPASANNHRTLEIEESKFEIEG
jgi:hypothetical protein